MAEAMFAIEKLMEHKDDELLEDLDEVSEQLNPSVSAYILLKMEDKEKMKFPNLVTALVKNQLPA